MSDPAPLVSIPEAPVPPRAAAHWLTAGDGVRLRCALFPAEESPRGSVVLSPGRTEPIENYYEVVRELNGRGFTVLVHDWRGQGLSQRLVGADRMTGHASGWRPFLADYKLLLDRFRDRLPGPRIAFGHSMGGGLTLLAVTELGHHDFSAVMLSAPMTGLKIDGFHPTFAALTVGLLSRIGLANAYALGPQDPFNEAFEDNGLTHDAHRWSLHRRQIETERSLALGGVTWGWVAFALELSARLKASRALDTLPIPLSVVAAGEERLVCNLTTQSLARRAPKGRYIEVPGAFHEVLMETDARRAQVWAEFDRLAAEVAPA